MRGCRSVGNNKDDRKKKQKENVPRSLSLSLVRLIIRMNTALFACRHTSGECEAGGGGGEIVNCLCAFILVIELKCYIV